MTFQVIPAIDLCGGKVVRLMRGDFTKMTVYHEDPVALAVDFSERGATRLHVVDLDGARDGKPAHDKVIGGMVAASGLEVEVGGGIRTLDTASGYLDGPYPARWVILGTAALKDPELVRQACVRWPGRVLVGIDARQGKVAVEGWIETSDATPTAVATAMADVGVAGIVYTDITRDGTGSGPNVETTAALARACGLPVIASGGVDTRAHIKSLAERVDDGVCGVVVGRALLAGRLSLETALACGAA